MGLQDLGDEPDAADGGRFDPPDRPPHRQHRPVRPTPVPGFSVPYQRIGPFTFEVLIDQPVYFRGTN